MYSLVEAFRIAIKGAPGGCQYLGAPLITMRNACTNDSMESIENARQEGAPPLAAPKKDCVCVRVCVCVGGCVCVCVCVQLDMVG